MTFSIAGVLRNMGLFGISLVLAVVVWVVAVNEDNPLEERIVPRAVPVEVTGLQANVMVLGGLATEATVKLRAPRLTWPTLAINKLRVVADVAQWQSGSQVVTLQGLLPDQQAEVVSIEPPVVTLQLARVVTRTLPVRVRIIGDPAIGYTFETPVLSVPAAAISGPEELIDTVAALEARIDLRDQREAVAETVVLRALNNDSQAVNGIQVSPPSVGLRVAVTQLGGYRDLAVRVMFKGSQAPGYRIKNIAASPPSVTVFSADPDVVAALPGYLETEPVDITEAIATIDARVAMKLPPDVSLASDQTVAVTVSIDAVESSIRIRRQVEATGLGPRLAATIAPERVDVLLSGPLPALEKLGADDVKVVLDLMGLRIGVHTVKPTVLITGLQSVQAGQVLPEELQVTIIRDLNTPTPKPAAP